MLTWHCSVFKVIPWNWKPLINRRVRGKKVFSYVILYYIVLCSTICVSFPSKSEATTVFPKHILKSKARDQSIQARKKVFCHVIVKNIYATFRVSFWPKSKARGGSKLKDRHPSWLYCTMVRLSEAATGGVLWESCS